MCAGARAPASCSRRPTRPGVVAQLPRALAQQVVAVDVSGSGLALDLVGGRRDPARATRRSRREGRAALAVLAHLNGAPFSYIDVSTPDATRLARVIAHATRRARSRD